MSSSGGVARAARCSRSTVRSSPAIASSPSSDTSACLASSIASSTGSAGGPAVGEGPEGDEGAAGLEGVVAAFDQGPGGADGGPFGGADVGAVEAGTAAEDGLGEALEGAEAAQQRAEAGRIGHGRVECSRVERSALGHGWPPQEQHSHSFAIVRIDSLDIGPQGREVLGRTFKRRGSYQATVTGGGTGAGVRGGPHLPGGGACHPPRA